MKLQMEYHNLTIAQLARKLNISRARETQMLNLLMLPEELKVETEAMGDHWERRLVTERMLRSKLCKKDDEEFIQYSIGSLLLIPSEHGSILDNIAYYKLVFLAYGDHLSRGGI